MQTSAPIELRHGFDNHAGDSGRSDPARHAQRTVDAECRERTGAPRALRVVSWRMSGNSRRLSPQPAVCDDREYEGRPFFPDDSVEDPAVSSSACLRLFAGCLVLFAGAGAVCSAPAILPAESFTVAEQTTRGAPVGQISGRTSAAGDVAGIGAHEFEIVAGNTEETFGIDGGTGELHVARPELLDYEIRSRFQLKVRWKRASAADATRRRFAADLLASNVDPAVVMELFTVSEERLVTIEVLDVDESPVIPAQSLTLVHDAADSSADPGRIHATDPDHGDTLSFEAIAGDPDGLLFLDATTGRIAIAPGRTVPMGQQVVPLTVRVTDRAGHSDAATVSIRLVGIPAPQIAQTPPVVDSSAPAAAPPAEDDAARPPAGPIETGAAVPDVAAITTTTAPPPVTTPESRHFSRPSFWFFLAGVLLGAGVMTIVFRYVARKSLAASMTAATTPRNPFGQPRPQPITITTAEQLHAIRSSVPARHVPAPVPAVSLTAVLPRIDEPVDRTSADEYAVRDEPDLEPGPEEVASGIDLAHTHPAPDVESITAVGFAVPLSSPDRHDGVSVAESQDSVEEPRPDEQPAPTDATDWPAVDVPSEIVPAECDLPLEPLMTAPTGGWADASDVDEPPQLVPPDDGVWHSPLDYPVDDSIDPVPEAASALDELPEFTSTPGLAETLDDVHEAAEALDEPSGITSPPESAESLDDVHEAAAVQEAAEALAEAQSPLGVDARVAELRQQLIELFGVPADRPALPDESPPPGLQESSVEFHLVKDVASDSARVDGLFESLRADLQQGPSDLSGASISSPGVDAAGRLSSTDAFVLTPLTPEVQLARSAQAEPASRVNKSAVRQEISSLREVANTHARAIVARQTTEKRARIVWLVSAACMVPLFSGGTYLLTSMPPGLLRWLGWVLLTGGAAAFSVCLNSFNRLSRLHEDSQVPDDSASPAQPHAISDTAEFDIPQQFNAHSPATVPAPPASIEPPQLTTGPELVDDGVYVHS
jgi:hypothetical protein